MKYKLQIKLIIIADIILAVIALYNSFLIYQKPALPFSNEFNNENVSKNSTEIFEKDDKVLRINNIAVRNKEELEFASDQFSIGESVLVSFQRKQIDVQNYVILVPYYSGFYIFIMLFVGFTFYLTGVFILLKNQNLKFSYIFHWFAIAAAGMIMLDFGKIISGHTFINVFLRSLYDATNAFTPLLFMHFSLLYPKETFPKFQKNIKYLYFIAIILCIFVGFYHIELLTAYSMDVFERYNLLHTYHLKYLMIPAIVFVIINYTITYFHTQEEEVKRRLKWIFLGIVSGPVFYIFIYELAPRILNIILIDESIMIAFLIVAPISFFISIYKYRVIDVNIILNKGLVFSIILVIYTGIFILFAYLFTPHLENVISNVFGDTLDIDILSKTSLILLSIIAIFVFEPFKNAVQNYIDKMFFRTKYNYKEVLNDFLGKVKDMPTIQDLMSLFHNSVRKSIPVSAFSVIWRDHEIQIIKSDKFNFEEEELNKIDLFIRNTDCSPFYSALNSTEEELDLPEITGLDNKQIKIIINSYQSVNQPGLTLLLGSKKSESRYSFEDLELLQTLLNSTSVALQKLMLQSELILKEAEALKLKEISEMKSYFVSSVSHELKTPLTAIKLYAEFLNSNPNLTEEKKKKYLAVIEGECNRLDRLINNVLGFSKIEKGTKTYKFETIDLKKIIEYIIETFQYQLKMQNFNLFFNTDSEGEYLIYGDEDSLKEVFINLISNSIKYSMNDKVIIINLKNNSNHILFSIEDKGIGIHQDEIESVFSAFYRSKEMTVSNLGGAGLGLAIVKNILDEHSASVEIESQLNKGTIFYIKFPKNYDN